MYIEQIKELKDSIKKNNRYEGCSFSGNNNGIKILGVIKLPNNINQNNHNVFLDLDDYRGLNYWVEGKDKIYFFGKPINEVGTDIPIWGVNNSIRIVGSDGKYSQSIDNLSADHTQYGHSSYYVLATLEDTVSIPDEPTVPNNDLLNALIALRDELNSIIERLQ